MSRVALIGNMNNNNFALMRHLRDLGSDAHLFLYSNEHMHFLPQCDTIDIERWQPYIHELGISNGGRDDFLRPIDSTRAALAGFDAYLGNGIAPVLFERLQETLDMFVPYGEGCEFIIEHEWKWGKPLASAYSAYRKAAMERALKRSVELVITANAHEHSASTFRRIGKATTNMFIPMLYDEGSGAGDVLTGRLKAAADRMDAASVAVFSHAAHIWKSLPVRRYGAGVGKRNQWLIEGFAEHIGRNRDSRALLVMVEYGPDVETSKTLIGALGIDKHVMWLPLMSRVQIMALLEHADLGGSEFAGMLWGGVGWEFLSKGVPMLHYLQNPESYALPGRPLPPFFNTSSPTEIAAILNSHDRSALKQMGTVAKAWYVQHQGRALAAEYLAILDCAAGRRAAGKAE